MKTLLRSLMLTALISALPAALAQADDGADVEVVRKVCCCPQGPKGLRGLQGDPGPDGDDGTFVLGYQEFVETGDGGGNSGLSAGDALTISEPLFSPSPITGLSFRDGDHSGTTFTFPAGRFVLDYEVSVVNGGSIAIYMGNVDEALTRIDASLTGNTSDVQWLHGRHIITVTEEQGTQDVIIGAATGSADFSVAFNATNAVPIVRLTITQLA